MKKKVLLVTMIAMLTAGLYAYIPDNTPENQFDEQIVAAFFEVTDLTKEGIKAIRQEVVSSSYDNKRTSKLGSAGLEESESGEENVTSKEIVYYEPKEEIYEAREVMDELYLWLKVYRTTKGDDVVTYKKMRKYIKQKSEALDKLINALKYEKDNKDSVLQYKKKMEKADKYFKRYMKRLKGKIVLIKGKPLPEPKDED